MPLWTSVIAGKRPAYQISRQSEANSNPAAQFWEVGDLVENSSTVLIQIEMQLEKIKPENLAELPLFLNRIS